jgi:hypothetical protein
MNDRPLPYDFDLFYDIKTLKDFKDVWYDRPTRCNGTRMDLIWMCRRHAINYEEIVNEDE